MTHLLPNDAVLLDPIDPHTDDEASPDKRRLIADIVVAAIAAERCLITTDTQVQDWMQRKVADHERWLSGMRRSAVTLG